MNYSVTTATTINIVDSALSVAAQVIGTYQSTMKHEKTQRIAGLTWKNAKIIASYTEYAFYAAALLCYQAGVFTRATLDHNLEVWFDANRDDLEALEAITEYSTGTVAKAWVYHAAKPYAIAAYERFSTAAKSERANQVKQAITGGLKKAIYLVHALASNIREGMFPRLNG